MNILITGGNGFLGSALVRFLIDTHNLYILENSLNSTNRIHDLTNRIHLLDSHSFNHDEFFSSNKVDIIIHTATCYKSGSASDLIESNILMPSRLLDFAEKNNVKAFLNTDSFFNKPNNRAYDYLGEYILSKNHFLEWGKKIARNCRFLNLRLEHIYGPNDNPSKFVSYIIDKLKSNIESVDLTDGTQERDFIYLDDVVSAYGVIIDKIDEIPNYQTIDIGKGYVNSVRDFVELCKIEIKSNTKLNFGALSQRVNEIMHSCANIEILRSLGWEAKFDIRKGIKELLQDQSR